MVSALTRLDHYFPIEFIGVITIVIIAILGHCVQPLLEWVLSGYQETQEQINMALNDKFTGKNVHKLRKLYSTLHIGQNECTRVG